MFKCVVDMKFNYLCKGTQPGGSFHPSIILFDSIFHMTLYYYWTWLHEYTTAHMTRRFLQLEKYDNCLNYMFKFMHKQEIYGTMIQLPGRHQIHFAILFTFSNILLLEHSRVLMFHTICKNNRIGHEQFIYLFFFGNHTDVIYCNVFDFFVCNWPDNWNTD